MLSVTYSLDDSLQLYEVLHKSTRGILRYLEIFTERV